MDRRASAEGVIKWIFVLFAGGIIMLFFMNAYSNYKATADRQALIDVTIKLTNILANAQGNPNTLFRLEIKDVQLTYSDCSKGLFLNGDPGLAVRLGSVFAPTTLKSVGNEYDLFVLPFMYPFRVTNFVYMTSPDIAYLFLKRDSDSTGAIAYLMDNRDGYGFPKAITQFTIGYGDNNHPDKTGDTNLLINTNLPSLRNNNYYEIRIVDDANDIDPRFMQNIPLNSSFSGSRIIEYRIDRIGSADGYVEMYEWEKDKSTGTYTPKDLGSVPFLDKSTLFGAIFSDSPQLYNCTLDDALTRYQSLLSIYYQRCDALGKELTYMPTTCQNVQGLYGACMSAINAINTTISGALKANAISNQDLANLYKEIFAQGAPTASTASLSELNDNYAKNKDCPLIY